VKRVLLILLCVFLVTVPARAVSGKHIAIDDEFDNLSAGWNTCYNWGCTITNSGEMETYSSENVYAQGGYLHLRATRDTEGQIRSGMIDGSGGRVHFLYGYLEVRAKMPVGQGFWPAIWLLTDDASLVNNKEIDVMEMTGDEPYRLYTSYHLLGLGTDSTTIETVADMSRWHVYALDWTPDRVTWYMDGRIVRQSLIDDWWIPQTQMYPLIDLAVGGKFPGLPDGSTQFPAEILIDYLRVYQYDSQ
jgi:beta-glucanase (GH16 family)